MLHWVIGMVLTVTEAISVFVGTIGLALGITPAYASEDPYEMHQHHYENGACIVCGMEQYQYQPEIELEYTDANEDLNN